LPAEEKSKGTFWSDTIALKCYVALGGILPFFFEKVIFNFTWAQWGGLHGIFYWRHLLVGRACGRTKDFFEKYFHKRVASLLAIYIWELPLYAVLALIIGVSKEQIVRGLIIQLVNNAILILLGLYDLILDALRQYFASRRDKQTKQVEQLEPAE
jgi:hypothetical protein